VGLATNYYYDVDNNTGLSTGAIAGITMACFIIIFVMICGIVYQKMKNRKKNGHLSGSS
jgi:hypothetical protein